MAITIEFYTLIIRRDRLEALLPGGWDQFLAEYGMPFDGWVDDDLVRFGTMNEYDFSELIAHWKRRGLVLKSGRGESLVWKDAVVTASPLENTIMGCDWLEVSEEDGCARFTGKRQKPRERNVTSNWSDDLVQATIVHCHSMLATPPEERHPIPMKNWNDGFALLTTDRLARKGLVLNDRRTREEIRFKYVEAMVNAGWVVD